MLKRAETDLEESHNKLLGSKPEVDRSSSFGSYAFAKSPAHKVLDDELLYSTKPAPDDVEEQSQNFQSFSEMRETFSTNYIPTKFFLFKIRFCKRPRMSTPSWCVCPTNLNSVRFFLSYFSRDEFDFM